MSVPYIENVFSIGKGSALSDNAAAGHSHLSASAIWKRALYPHSPLAFVARLASTGGRGPPYFLCPS